MLIASIDLKKATSGLSFYGFALKSRLAVPEKIYRSRGSLDFFDRCGKHFLAFSFPECARSAFPTSYARRSHNHRPQGNALRQNQKEKPPDWVVFFLVAETGLEPARVVVPKIAVVSPRDTQF